MTKQIPVALDVQTAIRFSHSLQQLLEAAAEAGGHSMGEEIRRRLWFSFAEAASPERLAAAADRFDIQTRYEKAWLSQDSRKTQGHVADEQQS